MKVRTVWAIGYVENETIAFFGALESRTLAHEAADHFMLEPEWIGKHIQVWPLEFAEDVSQS